VKLPSVTQAVADARRTFVRFPFVVLTAIAGTAAALALIDRESFGEPSFLIQVVFGAVFAFPLLTGLALTSEKRGWNSLPALGVQIGGVALSVVYALSVPQVIGGSPNIHAIRLMLFTTGWVLFTFSVPYLNHKSELGYWNYCKTLVMRIFTAGVYAVILWAGLAIALAALDNLFGVDVPGKRYGELWVLVNGIFSTWFFLAGIPENLDTLDQADEYPKGLKILSQYILFPLVVIYMVILYAYLGKILISWDWPQGWVSKLIIGFIATGLSSILLLHPIRERTGNIWIKTTARWFYVIIIPLIIMLFFAVARRVSEYGITEGRYLAIATGIWLCIVVPYFILSRKKMILFLPLSLCIVTFAMSFGPWGMFAVAENSQVTRLKEILTTNRILVDGKIRSQHDSIKIDAARQISSIIFYLSDIHGFDAIQPWFSESLKKDSAANGSSFKDPAAVAALMGIEYMRVWQASVDGVIMMIADRDAAVAIDGFDQLVRGLRVYDTKLKRDLRAQGRAFGVGDDLSKITVSEKNGSVSDSLVIDLQPLAVRLLAEYGNASTDRIPAEKMTITASSRTSTYKLMLSTIRIQRRGQEVKPVSFEGDVAIRKMAGEKK
jgi:hypothetical protein